jgi:hypothetical protein
LVNVVTVHYHPDGFPNDITDNDDHSLTTAVLEGCTPGFWKNQGLAAWDQPTDALPLAVQTALTGTSPTPDVAWTNALFRDVFDLTVAQMQAVGLNPDMTMLQAINLNGGGFKALARHGAAGILASASVNYTFDTVEVYNMVRDPIIANSTSSANTNAGLLGDANNLTHQSCPTS